MNKSTKWIIGESGGGSVTAQVGFLSANPPAIGDDRVSLPL